MSYDKVNDSGTRREFKTGAIRDAEQGKGRFDLLPFYALRRLAIHFENGAAKYSDRNWEKGVPLHSFVDSALRHISNYMSGGRDEDHLAAAAWNILCLIETEQWIKEGKLPSNLNDIPDRNPIPEDVLEKMTEATAIILSEIKQTNSTAPAGWDAIVHGYWESQGLDPINIPNTENCISPIHAFALVTKQAKLIHLLDDLTETECSFLQSFDGTPLCDDIAACDVCTRRLELYCRIIQEVEDAK